MASLGTVFLGLVASNAMRGLLFLVFGVLACAPASAQQVPDIRASLREGFAPPGEVQAEVGDVRYEVLCPENRVFEPFEAFGPNSPLMARGVRAYVEKPGAGYRISGVADTVLYGAIKQAWEQCPMGVLSIDGRVHPEYSFGFAELYAAPSAGEAPALVLEAKSFLGDSGIFSTVTDLGAQRERAETNMRAQQALQTQHQEHAVAEAVRQQRLAAQQAIAAAERAEWNASFWFWAKVALALTWACFLFSKRETFIRWYYYLTPHPAADIVEQAIQTHRPIDGRAFAEFTREMSDSPIEQEVRAAQARGLAEKARRHADALTREAQREESVVRSQAELAEATVAFELAQARLNEIRRRTGRS